MSNNGGNAETNLTVMDYFAAEAMKTLLELQYKNIKDTNAISDEGFQILTDRAYVVSSKMMQSRVYYT